MTASSNAHESMMPPFDFEVRAPRSGLIPYELRDAHQQLRVEHDRLRDAHERLRESSVVGLRRTGGQARSLHGPSVCAPDLVAREACRMLEVMARRRGVTIALDAQELPMLAIERNTLCALVLSLVMTSIVASPPGSEVVVDIVLVGGALTLVVADEGDGERANALMACTEVAEASNGCLTIATPTKGTVVTVRVPTRSV